MSMDLWRQFHNFQIKGEGNIEFFVFFHWKFNNDQNFNLNESFNFKLKLNKMYHLSFQNSFIITICIQQNKPHYSLL